MAILLNLSNSVIFRSSKQIPMRFIVFYSCQCTVVFSTDKLPLPTAFTPADVNKWLFVQ